MARWAMAAAAILILGCPSEKGSGVAGRDAGPERPGARPMGRDARSVGTFTEIEAGGALGLEVTVGVPTAVEVSADPEVLPLITTEVRGNRLLIGSRESRRPRGEVLVKVGTPMLTRLAASGATQLTARGIRGDAFRFEGSGAVKATLQGEVKDFSSHISGAGTVDAKDLRTVTTKVDVSGAGNLDVHATGALEATISGAGRVRYAGNPPVVRKQLTGVGSVEPR